MSCGGYDSQIDQRGSDIWLVADRVFAGSVEQALPAFGSKWAVTDEHGSIWIETDAILPGLTIGAELTKVTTPKGRTAWVPTGNRVATEPCPASP